jgi:predicted ABC-class ATPase
MKHQNDLKKRLYSLDGSSYKAYKQIRGEYEFDTFQLMVDYVQGDPFASPSQLAVRIGLQASQLPADTYHSYSRAVALRDYVSRKFALSCRKYSDKKGSGASGKFSMPPMGQEILQRNATVLKDDHLEVRFNLGLPASGRRILGRQAAHLLCDLLPDMVRETLYFSKMEPEHLYRHIRVAEDADHLRDRLRELKLVAFVTDGAILPRRSGADERPMQENARPFHAPASLSVSVDLPNAGKVSGMGIPEGVSLIVGGGYHGKSTLLRAISLGVYNHIPGDGRELVVCRGSAMKIRAEDERSVSRVHISPFISNLPFSQSTGAFSTPSASGSTSQAANIMEALEAGSELLLMDEDSSATNFMIRDHRMQRLISKEQEPITPFIDKVRQLYDELGVSSILVMGGSGDYFDVCDRVIALKSFKAHDLTEEAKEIARQFSTLRQQEGGESFDTGPRRKIDTQSLDPSHGRKAVRIKTFAEGRIHYGGETIDLSQLEQLTDTGQLKSIAEAMAYLYRHGASDECFAYQLDSIEQLVLHKGLDALSPQMRGDLSGFRRQELAAAINRYRKLKVQQDAR